MTKTIDTIVQDCDDLFKQNNTVSDDLLDWAGEEFRTLLKERFQSYGDIRKHGLRMSQVGKDLRLLYLESKDTETTSFPPHILRLFLFGDILEVLVLFMAQLSGHEVSDMQMEVELDGVQGHIDGKIDGTLVDIKSASGNGYKKFADGSILTDNDPYGYIGQLAGYHQSNELSGETEGSPALLVINKENAQMTLRKVHDLYMPDMSQKISDIRDAIDGDMLPPKCTGSEPIPQTKNSTNKKIGPACTFCKYKWRCWDNLRAFKYSNRTDYLCEVNNEPRVEEITHELRDKRTRFSNKSGS